MRRQAFTLLEILIVVAIILILLALALPLIKYSLDESKVREASRQLNSYAALAKAKAASTGRQCGLWLVGEQVGNPNATPGTFQCTQLFLAEVPAAYTGDILDARVVVTDSTGMAAPSATNSPWLLTFVPPGSAGSLLTLIPQTSPENIFSIQFDHKGPTFTCQNNSGQFVVTGGPTLPPNANGMYDPMANPYAGYQYKITRLPQRVGSPLSLPRGTCIDLTYSGIGNSGVNFFADNPSVSLPATANMPAVLLTFSPDGHVDSVSYRTWDVPNNAYRFVSDDAKGAIHFLVGRPEKVLSPRFGLESNLADNNALWVSVGRLTGSVVTTDNAPDVNLPAGTLAEQQAYMNRAREFAITQDVKGGR